MQWGIDVFSNTGTAITLPVAFTTTNYSITSCTAQNQDSAAWCVGIVEHKHERAITTFTAHGWNVAGTVTVYSNWFAVGS